MAIPTNWSRAVFVLGGARRLQCTPERKHFQSDCGGAVYEVGRGEDAPTTTTTTTRRKKEAPTARKGRVRLLATAEGVGVGPSAAQHKFIEIQ